MKMINTIKKQHNYNMIDLCKFLCAYVVIAYHTNPVVNCPDSLLAVLLERAIDLAVPFYFVATGFFLYIKLDDNKSEKIKKIDIYTKKIIKMYCIATIASFPLTIYGYVMSGNSIFSCLLSYLKYFFFVGKLYNSYHLWYLLSVIYFMIILRIMIAKNIKEEYVFMISFLFYVFFENMWYAIVDINNLSNVTYKAVKLFEYIFNNGIIFSGFIYIAIGILIAKYKKYINLLICIVAMFILYLVGSNLSQVLNDYLRLVEVTFLFMGMLGISLRNHKCYSFMRKMSIYVYISHLIFLSIYTFLIIKEPNKYGIDTFLVTSLASTLFAFLIVKFCVHKKEFNKC